jgi:hypothetical protein
MSARTKHRDRQLRGRPEVGRLRAVGGLSPQVIVDGLSLLRWCERLDRVDNYAGVVQAIVDAATTGRRRVLLLQPVTQATPLSPQHRSFTTDVGAAAFTRTNAAAHSDLWSLPSVVLADVQRDPEQLDAVEGGALNVLDIASGRLHHGAVRDRYDWDYAAREGNAAALKVEPLAARLFADVVAGSQRASRGKVYVASAYRRENDVVVLDRVAVDDGGRRYADGHGPSLSLLNDVIASGAPVVMTSSADVLDAVVDAGAPLPMMVEDPALACVVLDPDRRPAPPGIGAIWRGVLSEREATRVVAPDLDHLLDELPHVQECGFRPS